MLSSALPESGEQSPPKSRFSSGETPARTDADVAVVPLLARANLLKVRGQWEEAVAVCAEAIRRSPDSATAHSLLGDIYLAQGKNNDALHWYRMGLDRNPLQSGLAEKHDRLLAEQRAAATGGFSTTHLGGANKTMIPGEVRSGDERTAQLPAKPSIVLATRSSGRTSGRTTVERTLDWFDRVFPQKGAPGMPRSLFVITGVLTTLVVAAGAFLFFTLRKSDTSADHDTVLSEVRPVSDLPSLPIPKAPGTETPPRTVSPATTVISPSTTPTKSLIENLATFNNAEITVTAAQADAGRGQAQLEIALALHPGETTIATRTRILEASAKVSQATFAVLPTLQRFSVRVLLRASGNTGSADAVNANLVFIGETSNVGLQTLTTSSTPDYTLLSAQFTNTWWANNLIPRMP